MNLPILFAAMIFIETDSISPEDKSICKNSQMKEWKHEMEQWRASKNGMTLIPRSHMKYGGYSF